jgi:hypothetical protein
MEWMFQPNDLALDMVYSTLKCYQYDENLAKKHGLILEMTKLLVEKAQKRYKS